MISQEHQWLLKEKYRGEKTKEFEADCVRLEVGEPLAYIIGSIPFLNTTIYLDSHPLIPRPETEFWVENAIEEIKLALHKLGGPTPKLHVLDLCAGSGAIGIAVAKAIPETHITFGEIEKTHLPTIQKNITANLLVNRKVCGDQYQIIESDLFENISGVFDFILTNPPYINKSADTAEKSVVDNEPEIALFGGVDGFEIIKKIINRAHEYLQPYGVLYIEHEPSQTKMIQDTAYAENFSCTTYTDQYKIERYSVLSRV